MYFIYCYGNNRRLHGLVEGVWKLRTKPQNQNLLGNNSPKELHNPTSMTITVVHIKYNTTILLIA